MGSKLQIEKSCFLIRQLLNRTINRLVITQIFTHLYYEWKPKKFLAFFLKHPLAKIIVLSYIIENQTQNIKWDSKRKNHFNLRYKYSYCNYIIRTLANNNLVFFFFCTTNERGGIRIQILLKEIGIKKNIDMITAVDHKEDKKEAKDRKFGHLWYMAPMCCLFSF